jgi:hypothetical protein
MDRIIEVVQASGCVLGQEIEVERATREALIDAVVHGNHMDPHTWVTVRCECDRDQGVSIVIRDERPGHVVRLHKASVAARIRSGLPSRPIPLFPPPAPWRAALGGLYQAPVGPSSH